MFRGKIVAALCVLVCAACAGAEAPYPLNPARQPLAVVRADAAELFRDVLRTRQARAFGAEERDFSGRIPGAEVSVASLRRLLEALADADAENLWYCLLQEGGSLARRTGGFGWDEPGAATPERLRKRLADLGLDMPDRIAGAEAASPGMSRIRIARDREADRDLLSGAAGSAESWRESLADFLARRDSMVGLFANSRPLFGVLSLLTDIDFRSLLARCSLSLPVSVQLELFNNAGDLGFEARLNNLLPQQLRAEHSGRQQLLSFRKDPLLEVNFPAPELLRRHMPFDAGLFALANIDMLALLPQTLNVTVWRKEDGSLAWAAVALVSDREAFGTQLRRVYALAEALALGGAFALETGEAVSPGGIALRILRSGSATLAAGIAEGEGGDGYFIASGSVGDWPDPGSIRRASAGRDSLARYRAFPDAESGAWIAKELAALTRRQGKEIGENVWKNALPEKDSGYLALDGGDLVLLSRNGLLPFLIPLFY